MPTEAAPASLVEEEQLLLQATSTANHSFVIENDMFVKDGVPFRILGGDLHYFRVHPQASLCVTPHLVSSL